MSEKIKNWYKKMIYLLLYSGGVDSILCLKRLVEKGIVPYIFHFWTKKLNKTHEKMIRKTARLLSPKSPFYVFKTDTYDYEARIAGQFLGDYEIIIDDDEDFIPIQHADYIVIGYAKYIYPYKDEKYKYKSLQQQFIEHCRIIQLPYLFPLASYTRDELDEEFMNLPEEVRMNTVSSTRDYDYGGKVFIPPEDYDGMKE